MRRSRTRTRHRRPVGAYGAPVRTLAGTGITVPVARTAGMAGVVPVALSAVPLAGLGLLPLLRTSGTVKWRSCHWSTARRARYGAYLPDSRTN